MASQVESDSTIPARGKQGCHFSSGQAKRHLDTGIDKSLDYLFSIRRHRLTA
jgi:hypothetical protein